MMKTFMTMLLWSTILTTKAEENIRIVRYGTNVTDTPSAGLTTNIINYLQSGCINSTVYAIKTNTWRDLERSDSFVLLTFSTPRKLVVMLRTGEDFPPWDECLIDQILVPLPETRLASHVFARHGTNILSVTKCEPYPLKLIAFEPAVKLSSAQTYASLDNIQPPKWWPTNGIWIPPTKEPE
jgi:hypothetical protein